MVDTNVSEVHAASSSVLWVVTLYSVVGYKPFRGQCCLHLQCYALWRHDLWNFGILPQCRRPRVDFLRLSRTIPGKTSVWPRVF